MPPEPPQGTSVFAHSGKVFSGILQKMPRSGVAASTATVAFPPTRCSNFRTYVAKLQLSAWYQVDHNRSRIRWDVSAARSTRRDQRGETTYDLLASRRRSG